MCTKFSVVSLWRFGLYYSKFAENEIGSSQSDFRTVCNDDVEKGMGLN